MNFRSYNLVKQQLRILKMTNSLYIDIALENLSILLLCNTNMVLNFSFLGCLASEEMKSNLKTLDQRGSDALEAFLRRIVIGKGQEEEEPPKTYYDKITKEKIVSFTIKKAKKEISAMQDEKYPLVRSSLVMRVKG